MKNTRRGGIAPGCSLSPTWWVAGYPFFVCYEWVNCRVFAR